MNEKTTVYLNTQDLNALKAIGKSEKRTASALIRLAVAEFLARRAALIPPGTAVEERIEVETAEELLKGSGPG